MNKMLYTMIIGSGLSTFLQTYAARGITSEMAEAYIKDSNVNERDVVIAYSFADFKKLSEQCISKFCDPQSKTYLYKELSNEPSVQKKLSELQGYYYQYLKSLKDLSKLYDLQSNNGLLLKEIPETMISDIEQQHDFLVGFNDKWRVFCQPNQKETAMLNQYQAAVDSWQRELSVATDQLNKAQSDFSSSKIWWDAHLFMENKKYEEAMQAWSEYKTKQPEQYKQAEESWKEYIDNAIAQYNTEIEAWKRFVEKAETAAAVLKTPPENVKECIKHLNLRKAYSYQHNDNYLESYESYVNNVQKEPTAQIQAIQNAKKPDPKGFMVYFCKISNEEKREMKARFNDFKTQIDQKVETLDKKLQEAAMQNLKTNAKTLVSSISCGLIEECKNIVGQNGSRQAVYTARHAQEIAVSDNLVDKYQEPFLHYIELLKKTANLCLISDNNEFKAEKQTIDNSLNDLEFLLQQLEKPTDKGRENFSGFRRLGIKPLTNLISSLQFVRQISKTSISNFDIAKKIEKRAKELQAELEGIVN